MKLREVVEGWPLSAWSSSWAPATTLGVVPGRLKLYAFTGPGKDGWFTMGARDPEGQEWSTFFRVDPNVEAAVERALLEHIGTSLEAIGNVEVS